MADDARGPIRADETTKPNHLITVFLNTVALQIEGGEYTTETLIAALLEVPPGNVLDVVEKEHGQPVLRELQPGETIEVRDREEFISHVPTGGAA